MPFRIIRNDITRVSADVIVNTANPQPIIGGGTDAAVYAAAGAEKLLARRRRIGDIAPGQAAATPAFHLPARHIIHTVGPVWVDGRHGERETLRACYANTLALAAQLRAKSIAFPLIATGVYGFPKDEALNIALSEIGRFLLTHDMLVTMVVFDRSAFELSGRLVGEIEEYIDDHAVREARAAEYGALPDECEGRRKRTVQASGPRSGSLPRGALPSMPRPAAKSSAIPDGAPLAALSDASLEDVLQKTGETFQQRLLFLIDHSGMTNAEVYKKANIDRRVFSRMQSKKDYKPKKVTAVAFAIALKLDMDTMTDLLSRAEIALSPSSKFDLIISYFVTHGNYDIFEINAALFQYGQPILGE